MSLSLIEELELQVIALRGNHLLNSSLIVQRAIDALESQTREVERRDGRIAELIAQCNEIYALKAQPSGVVLPERQMYTAYLSGVVPSNAVEVNSYRDGWNACLDEVARLNSSPASAGWMMPTVKQLEQALESVPSFHDLSTELIAPAMLEHLREVISAGEYGDAYQGARQDLLIWKRRALEAETKVREQDQVIENLGNALNAESGPTFMGEPVMPASAGEPLPHWEPCNPGCDPDFNGQRSRECAQLCRPAREALSASGGDERAAFEAWRLEKGCGGAERLKKCSNAPDVYYYTAEQEAWKVWQARAALSANHSEQVREGYVQVPKSMLLEANSLEALVFVGGGITGDDGVPTYIDCVLWVGDLLDDDGKAIHGLHAYCTECEEEGSTTLAEFAAAPSAGSQKEQE